jgi:hypothetical protein
VSIEIILLPLAVAAISAWQAKSASDEAGRHIIAVNTRMRNEHLLERALCDTGATVAKTGEVITASWERTRGRFTKDPQGVWSVHLVGDADEGRATTLVGAIDAAYGRHVQQEVLSRLRERAPDVGMDIESETVEEDNSVTMVLNVSAGASQ